MVIVFIIAAAGGYLFVANGHNATLNIEVYSTHFLADTEITVYVNGENVGTWATGNLEGWEITYNYTFSLFDDSESIMVRAVSEGGYLGNQSDQEAVLVKNGGTYNVTLYV